jgi:hypothetical protein
MRTHTPRFIAALLIAALSAPVAAQHSSGNIMGDGKAGDVVRVERKDTGFNREVKVAADGKYRISRVPTGVYVVIVTHADGTVDKAKQVNVQIGTTTRVK